MMYHSNIEYDRRRGRYRVRKMVNGRIHKGTFPTKRAAILFLEKIVLEGRGIHMAPMPELTDAIEAHVEDCRLAGRSESTLRYYEMKRVPLERELAGPLNHINQGHIDAYVKARRDDGVTNGTINKEIAFLRAVYKFHETDPPWRLRALSHRSKRKRVLPPEVVREILQNVPEPVLCAVGLCLFAGMRAEEVWRADASWVHGDEIDVAMHKSGGDTNRTWLVETLRNVLPKKGPLVARHKWSVTYEMTKVSEKLDIEPRLYGPGIFRHCCATYATELGFPRDNIKLVLGHQFGDVTDRYLHSQQIAKKRAILEAVERYILGTTDDRTLPDVADFDQEGNSANP
jgi:integrase